MTRFETYLQYFIDGNVSLDYLKAIVVPETILKVNAGKTVGYFPAFVVLDGDLTANDFDSTLYNVNYSAIRNTLTDVVTYIQNSLFAQDIALLNDMAGRFTKSININNSSNQKLLEEQAKLKAIDDQLQAQLLEAKKIYTAYDVLMSSLANNPDPVVAYTNDLENKLASELARQAKVQAEQLALIQAQEDAKKQAEAEALALAEQLKIQQAEQAKAQLLAEQQAREAQLKADAEYQEMLKMASQSQAIVQSQTAIATGATNTNQSNDTQINNSTTKSSKLPLVLGLGVLAWFGLQGE